MDDPGMTIEWLLKRGLDEPWARYDSGRKGSEVPWRSAGVINSQREGQGRVVLEVLVHPGFGGQVIRVFEEDPFLLHYAKRAEGEEVIRQIVLEAAVVFETLDGEATEDLAANSMEMLGIDLKDLLNPIPPPFTIEEIPLADPTGSDE